MNEKKRIIIADDHAIVREGLKQILAAQEDMDVIDDVETGQELIEKVRREKYDIILLDITLPDRNGLEILKQIRSEKIEIPVLILSMHPEEQYATRSFKAGASGYVTKRSAPKELVTAVRKIIQGGKYVSSRFAEKLVEQFGTDHEKASFEELSDRELQILSELATGKTVNDIARELFLSVSTISTYRRRILDKLHLKNNIELAQYARDNKLID